MQPGMRQKQNLKRLVASAPSAPRAGKLGKRRKLEASHQCVTVSDDESDEVGAGAAHAQHPAAAQCWARPLKAGVCPICLCDYDGNDGVCLSRCAHSFCQECVTHYVRGKVADGEVLPEQLQCPHVDPTECKRALAPSEVLRCLGSKAERERYERLTLQRCVDMGDDMSCCPTPGCAFSFAWDKDNRKLNCPVCNKSFCLVCRAEPWHAGVRCEQYQAEHGDVEQADKAFASFAAKQKLRQCPKCRFWVEKVCHRVPAHVIQYIYYVIKYATRTRC